jgi:hypothetical protein
MAHDMFKIVRLMYQIKFDRIVMILHKTYETLGLARLIFCIFEEIIATLLAGRLHQTVCLA